MIVYIIIAIIVIIIIYCFGIYNQLVKLNNRVNEAFATMDVYLKKRWDLIPNLVTVTKEYAAYEKETLTEVINLRNSSYDTMSDADKLKTNAELNQSISRMMLLAEQYPVLKASENFQNLNAALTSIENDIASARKYYNGTVRLWNDKIEMFPSNLIAKLLGYKSKPMFMANAQDRESIKIEW
jgi:LemA protein